VKLSRTSQRRLALDVRQVAGPRIFMSVQIFVQARLTGVEDFLATPPAADPEATFIGRQHWSSLLAEVLPRALLAELGLAKILLGASGGDQFFVVLPAAARDSAERFLGAAAEHMSELSGGRVALVWAITENLGDWSDVRKRLSEELSRKSNAPAAGADSSFFAPFEEAPSSDDEYFAAALGPALRDAKSVGWSPEEPGRALPGAGKHIWPLDGGQDAIPLAMHYAPGDDNESAADAATLARRAGGRAAWGVLRGDVDNFMIRLRRLPNIEEHLQLSLMYKQFFQGELKVLCSMPEFWRKINLLHSGGQDFSVYGAWDALLPFARELQRLFHRFTEENLRDLPGAEGKTLTMAIALASEADESLASVYQAAGWKLEIAKSTDKDCIYALGRTLEWKQLSDAAELKDDLARLVREFGSSPEYIKELCGMYRETAQIWRRRSTRAERPWRIHRRVQRILPVGRSRDFQKARNSIVANLVGKNPASVKLRPSGRVALEWARLATEEHNGD
jgi:CRISPR-associated protein Csm1